MSFKILILILLAAGCGVKGDPATPKSTAVPSLMENYSDIQTEKPLDDVKQKR